MNNNNSNNNFEINGFTRIVWKNQKSKDEWNNKLIKVTDLYNKLEFETLKRDVRRACTIHVNMNNLGNIINKLNKEDMIFTPITKSASYQGFSHKHIVPKPDQPSHWYGCVTKNIEDAEAFKIASNSNNNDDTHIPIGELLGFPKCCSRRFTEIWKTGNYDGMFEIAKETTDSELKEYNNKIVCTINDIDKYSITSPLLRYFGIRIISHFPCQLKCNKSLDVANKWLDIMYDIDNDTAGWLVDILGQIETWDSLNGVVEVHTPHFVGITHTYPLLNKNRIIKIKDKYKK